MTIDDNTPPMMNPKTGAPFLFSLLNILGNKLSFAVAMDICPVIKIHPFNTPSPEITTPTATKYPP